MNPRGLLKRASLEDLQAALRYQRNNGKRENLEEERDTLTKALAKVEKKLAKLDGASGNGSAATAGRPQRRASSGLWQDIPVCRFLTFACCSIQ